MKKHSKILAIFLVMSMLLPGLSSVVQAAEGDRVTRLAGDDRSLTSIAVSNEAYKTKKDDLVLVGYNGAPDALAGTLLANSVDAPVLSLAKTGITTELINEMTRLGTKTVHILGGEAAVSAAIETQLEELGFTVNRIAGQSRWATAAELAGKAKTTDHVFMALGRNVLPTGVEDSLADALAVGPVSAMKDMPILLTKTDKLPAETKQALTDLNVEKVTIVGGIVAVNSYVLAELEAMNIEVNRIAGESRWETAKVIAETYFTNPAKLILANGRKDADALVGGYLGAKENAPILLTKTNAFPSETKAYMEANQLDTYVLGGTGVVNAAVVTEVEKALEEVEEDLKVVSVSAINAKTLGVTFNKELTADEKADAVFALKRANNSLQTAAVVWDGAVAQIQRADKAVLTAGDYEVTVTGVTDEALVGTATVEARKATSIEITSDRANPAASQKLGYVVSDQYGDDMDVAAGLLTVSAFNTTNSTRTVTGSIGNMDFSSALVDDVVKVTAYLTSNPSVKDVKDITVSNIRLGEVSLGEAELPETADRFEVNTSGVIIPVMAKDNFGNDMKLTAENWTSGSATSDGLEPVFSGFSAKINAKGNLEVDLGATAGTAKLTLTNPATGDVIVKEIEVLAAPDTATITLSQPEDPIRLPNTNKSKIPFELKDQYGEEMTVASAGWANTDVNLSSSNSSVATVAWNSNDIEVTPVGVGTTTIFANVVTPFSTGTVTLTIEVKAEKEAVGISLNGTPTTSLATGQTVAADVDKGGLSFKIVDQDGKAINLAANGAVGVKAKLTVTDTDSVLATPPTAGILDAGKMVTTTGIIDPVKVVAHGTNTGTATVKVQLFNDLNKNETMDAGEELDAEVTVVYTVEASKISKGQFTAITSTNINADGTAAYAAPNAAQTLTYSLQDQAGNAMTTTSATNVTWTVKNTGTKAVTVNDGTAKTLAAGATGTYTTVAAAGASANATLTVNTGANEPNKLEVTAAAQGVATPAETDVYFTDLTVVNTDKATYTGTVVAFDKTAKWAVISTSVGNVVLTDYTATATYTVDGNTALVPAFENALTIGDTLKVTADGTDAVYALTNN